MLSSAAVFWGWQSAHWWIAVPLVALLEAPRLFALEVKLSPNHLKRIATGCLFFLTVLILVLFLRPSYEPALLQVIEWTPLIFAPFALGLLFSRTLQLDIRTLVTLPRQAALYDANSQYPVSFGYPYFALFLLAASVPNRTGPGFFIGLTLLASWALWHNRPANHTALVWGYALLIALLGGGALSLGLYRLQSILENASYAWLTGESDPDPNRAETSLGHVGKMKLSSAIILRATPGPNARNPRLPLLLMTASYNTFAFNYWKTSSGNQFREMAPEKTLADRPVDWLLKTSPPGISPGPSLKITTHSFSATALVALPHGAFRVQSRDFQKLEGNSVNTVQAGLNSKDYIYEVTYGPAALEDNAPSPADSALPDRDAALFRSLASRLQLPEKPPEMVLEIVKAYFAQNFTYNLWRKGNGPNRSAMEDFLQYNPSGHCEHFATASVLLLRAAGLPARYSVGYSLQERSRFGNSYLVRQRDAHAWTRVYVKGAWRDLDTTPADLSRLGPNDPSALDSFGDAWWWLVFAIRALNASGHPPLAYAIGALALSWSTRKLLRWKPNFRWSSLFGPKRFGPASSTSTQARSPFSSVEQVLLARGLAREPHESFQIWLTRIRLKLEPDASAELLNLATIHYRYRFGPPPADSEAELLRGCRAWIARYGRD